MVSHDDAIVEGILFTLGSSVANGERGHPLNDGAMRL